VRQIVDAHGGTLTYSGLHLNEESKEL
jgi:hypothetical protein